MNIITATIIKVIDKEPAEILIDKRLDKVNLISNRVVIDKITCIS